MPKRYRPGREETHTLCEDEIMRVYQQIEDADHAARDLTLSDIHVPSALITLARHQGLRSIQNQYTAPNGGRLTRYALEIPKSEAQTVAAMIEDLYYQVKFEMNEPVVDEQITSAFWKRIRFGTTDIPSLGELEQEQAAAERAGLHGGHKNRSNGSGQGGGRS